MDFNFYFQEPCAKMQNILLQHMHEREGYFRAYAEERCFASLHTAYESKT